MARPRIGQGNWIYAVTLVAVAGLLWFAYSAVRQHPMLEQKPAVAKPVPKGTPADNTYQGTIRATKTLPIPAPIDGTLEEVSVADGEEVFEGQLLARINNTTVTLAKQKAEEDLAQARAKLEDSDSQLIAARLEASRADADASRARLDYEAASKNYERQRMLFREGATAKKQFEASEAAFLKIRNELNQLEETQKAAASRVKVLQEQADLARARVADLTEDLEEAEAEMLTGEVKAPVTGFLVSHKKEAGDAVTRDVADLFEIAVDLTALEVVVPVPDELAKQLAAGQNALVQLAEAGPQPLEAKVREVKSGTAAVEFLSPNPAIRPGMTAQVRFLLTVLP
jgi:multidrug resistance efflux pump